MLYILYNLVIPHLLALYTSSISSVHSFFSLQGCQLLKSMIGFITSFIKIVKPSIIF